MHSNGPQAKFIYINIYETYETEGFNFWGNYFIYNIFGTEELNY